jgi:hypothetical protein
MLRTLLAALGVLFAAIVVFCVSFLGNIAADIERDGPDYEQLAVTITRDVSRAWKVADVEPHYSEAAKAEAGVPTQKALDALKPLGSLLYADDLAHQARWSRTSWLGIVSPADAAQRLSELLSKTVTVTFVGKFAKGFADVRAEFRSEGGRMKLWRLQIDSREVIPPEQEQSRRLISHA